MSATLQTTRVARRKAKGAASRHLSESSRPHVPLPFADVPEIAVKDIRPRKARSAATSHLSESSTAMTPHSVAETCASLIDLQIQRVFCIKSQSRCDRSMEALIARTMGFSTDMSEADRKELFKDAGAYRRRIEKGDGPGRWDNQLGHLTDIIKNSAAARQAWDKHREGMEGKMDVQVRNLPIWRWAEGVKGFGAIGLGAIIGEAGNLSNYPTIEKLWKRVGLAVIDAGYWMRCRDEGIVKEEYEFPLAPERQRKFTEKIKALVHGYCPRRRAEMWMISDAMLRHQWMGENAAYRVAIRSHPEANAYCIARDIDLAKTKGDPLKAIAAKFGIVAEAHAIGPYGEIYARRKERTADRGWTPKHRDNDARRIMIKALLRDLWKQWRIMAAA